MATQYRFLKHSIHYAKKRSTQKKMKKRLYGLRGATGAENTQASMQQHVAEMCKSLFTENKLQSEDIVSIHFTLTKDLTAVNPCAALRKSDIDIDVSKCALFASQEVDIENAPTQMIRILITAYLPENATIHHCYIHGAEKLRPDFAKKN